MWALIVAIIVFGLTNVISILVLFRYGMSDNQSLPPSTAAEKTFTVGTLIAFAIAASHCCRISNGERAGKDRTGHARASGCAIVPHFSSGSIATGLSRRQIWPHVRHAPIATDSCSAAKFRNVPA
jgi:hypothetical protein